MKSDRDLREYCLGRLEQEGIEAYTEVDEYDDVVLRVPALEGRDDSIPSTSLSFKKCMALIHGKLQNQPLKGLKVSSPIEGDDYSDIYCYDPDIEGRALESGDVRIWSVNSNNEVFDWTGLVDDDSSWGDGWDGVNDGYDPRLFFLAGVLGAELIDLPAPAPLSYAELVGLVRTSHDDRGIHCQYDAPNLAAWLMEEGEQLVLALRAVTSTGMSNVIQSTSPITEANIENGRLTFEGKVILTRATSMN